MGILSVILVVVYVIVCIFLVLVVLLQQGKGADLAGAFGGGGSQTSFGPRSSTNYMHRATTISFVLFVLLSITLAVRSGMERGQSVVAGVETEPTPVTQEQSLAADPGDEDVPGVELPLEQPLAGDEAGTPDADAEPAAGTAVEDEGAASSDSGDDTASPGEAS